jgi:hypothetical protein
VLVLIFTLLKYVQGLVAANSQLRDDWYMGESWYFQPRKNRSGSIGFKIIIGSDKLKLMVLVQRC